MEGKSRSSGWVGVVWWVVILGPEDPPSWPGLRVGCGRPPTRGRGPDRAHSGTPAPVASCRNRRASLRSA
eukprot:3173193-Pyramimonas_sp.AAC.1